MRDADETFLRFLVRINNNTCVCCLFHGYFVNVDEHEQMKLSTLAQSQAKHVLVFGPPKLGGKTYLVGQLALHGFNLKWFDLESGRGTLHSSLPLEAQERIDMFPIPDTKAFPIAIETMLEVIKGDKKRICLEHGKVSCHLCLKNAPASFSEICLNDMTLDDVLVIDSWTQLANSCMSHIGKGKDDTWKPDWEHYRTQGSMLDRIASTIQNAPYNVVVISHEVLVKGEDKSERLVPVGGTDNFSRNFAKYFGEVVYSEVKNRKHRAASSTVYSPSILTGSRSQVSLDTEEKPELVKIFRPSEPTSSVAQNLLKGISK